jgi:hypothetical protein
MQQAKVPPLRFETGERHRVMVHGGHVSVSQLMKLSPGGGVSASS